MTTHPAPQLALIALSKTMARDFTGWVEGAKSQTKFVVDMADHLVALKDIAESTQSRPEAELPEVTGQNSADRLLAALERAGHAESALRRLVDECDNDRVPGWEDRMQACIAEANGVLSGNVALQAAYGQQCAATRPDEVGGDERDAARFRALESWFDGLKSYQARIVFDCMGLTHADECNAGFGDATDALIENRSTPGSEAINQTYGD